jgi:hypothetical protein
VTGWDELVTTALLGTARRALPTGLPDAVAGLAQAQQDAGLAVLDAAAGFAAYRDAGRRVGTCPEPPPAPRQTRDFAPDPAHELLLTFLADRAVGLVDAWLSACAARGLGVRARAWVPLATAAASPHGPDRGLVRAVLGGRGLAFLALHPRWRALAVSRPAPASERAVAPGPGWSAAATDLALAAVQVTRSLGRRRLSVRPPDGHDLRRLVADTDVSAWQRHTGLDPEEFLAQLRGAVGDRFPELSAALAHAALAQRDEGWVAALVRSGSAPVALLESLPGPWGDPAARAALELLESGVLTPQASRRLALVLAQRAPLTLHRDLEDLAQRESGAAHARGFAEVLLGRLRILHVFDPSTPEETP